ncbi:MAG: hypothetical protein ACRDOU_22150 [Streptosporangiaceae bacterium]
MQRSGDPAGLGQERQVVGHLFGHRPAKFPRHGRLVPVRLTQQQVSSGSIGPGRRRRVDFLEHRQRQAGAAGRELPPRRWVPDELGHDLIAPPLRPGWQPAPGISHTPHLGRQIGRYGFHPRLPRDRQARVDEDVAAYLADEGTRRSQQRSRPTVPDEDRGLAGCAARYYLGLARAIGRPGRNSAGQVRDVHLVAPPGQVSRHQVPACAPRQRAMDKQHPSSHASFVSATRPR